MFASKNFIVSGLIFKPIIHIEFSFVHGVRKCSNFILLQVALQLSQYHLWKRYASEISKGRTHILKVSRKRTKINFKENKLMMGIS